MKKMILMLTAVLAVFSCGHRDNKPIADPLHVEEISNHRAEICEMGREYANVHSWNNSACDSVMVAAIWSMACGDIPMDLFMSNEGQLFRTTDQDCFPGPSKGGYGGSATDVSKDMYVGWMLYVLKYRRLDLVKKTIAYGVAHNWVMGDGKNEYEILSRCVLSPTQINRLYDIEAYLEGKTNLVRRTLVEREGFEAHLEVLMILLDAVLYGAITDDQLKVLKWQAERQPDNPLFAFAYRSFNSSHDVSRAIAVMLDSTLYPRGRLPNSGDHCNDYLFSHDVKRDQEFTANDGGCILWYDPDSRAEVKECDLVPGKVYTRFSFNTKDWFPCADKGETYLAADFAIAASLLDGSFFKKVSAL